MISIRRATLADIAWMRKLALESVVFGVPEGRDIPNQTVREAARDKLANLEMLVHRKKQVALLVAEVDGERAGYLILEFDQHDESTGDRQSFIYDLAVAQEFWGRRVPHRLVREAARVTAQQGHRFMAANITASNQRALLTALPMGFSVERYGLIMACDAEGPAPMPGRPAAERGHALSRQVRRASRFQAKDQR